MYTCDQWTPQGTITLQEHDWTLCFCLVLVPKQTNTAKANYTEFCYDDIDTIIIMLKVSLTDKYAAVFYM